MKNDNNYQLLENPNIFQTTVLCQIMLKHNTDQLFD